jgi:hypothetical protein
MGTIGVQMQAKKDILTFGLIWLASVLHSKWLLSQCIGRTLFTLYQDGRPVDKVLYTAERHANVIADED